MDEFVKFWGSIWERDDRTPCMPWIEEIQEELEEKIISMKEFDINDNGLDSEIKNRIKLDSARVDGIQNFCWEKFRPAYLSKSKMITDWSQYEEQSWYQSQKTWVMKRTTTQLHVWTPCKNSLFD